MNRHIHLPSAEPEMLTRNAIIELISNTELPVCMKCVIERISVRESAIGHIPIFQLNLLVYPPEVMDKLVPFHAYLSRQFNPPKQFDEPFYFEEVLGKVTIPWGETLTNRQATKLLAPWLGKTAIVKFETREFEGKQVLRPTNLLKEEPVQ